MCECHHCCGTVPRSRFWGPTDETDREDHRAWRVTEKGRVHQAGADVGDDEIRLKGHVMAGQSVYEQL